MEISKEENLEIIFTLKLNKSFVKNVQDYPTFAENLMIVKNDPRNECVGSVAISNPVIEQNAVNKAGSLRDCKSPKKRGRKRKPVDSCTMLKMVQQAKGPKTVEQSVSLQEEMTLELPQPLDLSTKAAETKSSEDEKASNDDESVSQSEAALSISENVPLDLSTAPVKKPNESSEKEPTEPNSEAGAGVKQERAPLIPTEDPNRKVIPPVTAKIEEEQELSPEQIIQMHAEKTLDNNNDPKVNVDGGDKQPAKRRGPKPSKHLTGNLPDSKKNGEPKSFACTLCNFTATNRRGLIEHELADHVNARPFMCTLCEHRCKQKQNLKLHYLHKHKLTSEEASEILKKHPKCSTKNNNNNNNNNTSTTINVPISQVSVAPQMHPISAEFNLEHETERPEMSLSPASSICSRSSSSSVKEENAIEICEH